MSYKSSYKVSLEPQVLRRAKLILGSLLLLFTIITITGIYQGVVSGYFDKVFLKPFREFGTAFEQAINATPTPLPSLTTVIPSSSPQPVKQPAKTYTAPVQPTQPVVSNCIRMNIREGEFASNKCYLEQDYEDLQYYLGRFQSAKLNLSSAEGFMKIDCGAAQTFEAKKADCEKDKQDKAAAEAEVNKYRGIIQGIIAKGK